ncbi:MAG: DUF2085 domain-containing protein [Candidatus Eremiobacterota bacterium]
MLKKLILLSVFGMFFFITVASVMAPYFASHNNRIMSDILYGGMRPLCHQKPERCIFLWGHQMAICERCFAIYIFLIGSGIFLYIFRKSFRKYHWKLAILLLVPVALDGLTQLTGLRESNIYLRLFTGSLSGIAFALLLCPPGFEICLDDYQIEI